MISDISTIFSAISAVGTLSGVLVMALQLRNMKKSIESVYEVNRSDHEWNRRMAAQQALKEYNKSILVSGLQEEFNYLNCKDSIPLSDILGVFKRRPDLQTELHQILNFYEGLARGIFHNIYDEEIIKSARRGAMIRAFRAFNSYIEHRRRTMSPNAWVDLETLVAKWIVEEKGKIQREPTHAKSQNY